jgi:hypothetical protein
MIPSNSMAKLSRSNTRLLISAGKSVSKVTEKAATGLFRWATTDHTGITERLANMPSMGFLDTLGYLLVQLLITVVAALATGLLVFLFVGYGIPYFFFGSF